MQQLQTMAATSGGRLVKHYTLASIRFDSQLALIQFHLATSG